MNLRDRLGSLCTASANSGASGDALSLTQRVERMALAARTRHCGEREVAKALEAAIVAPGLFRIERDIPLTCRHGKVAYAALLDAPLTALCANEPLGEPLGAEQMVFIDTETSGLAGGAGTLAFLLAMARIEGGRIRLCQWLLGAFAGESVMLEEARRWLPGDAHLVSFNGKSFDVPLLATRYCLHRLPDPYTAMPHLDLMHGVRRAFARRWEDCRLQTAEQRLLKFYREDDLPGSAMPRAWLDFLHTGDARPMHAVLAHNQRDVLALIALCAALAEIYTRADASECDATTIARSHLAAGRPADALTTLATQLPLLDQAGLLLLAALLRRSGRRGDAVAIWRRLADEDCAEAIEQLAKHHEHHGYDPAAALTCTERLTSIAGTARTARRETRLKKKIARRGEKLF